MKKKKIIIFTFILFAIIITIYYNKLANNIDIKTKGITEDQYLSKSFITTKYSTGGNVIIKTK